LDQGNLGLPHPFDLILRFCGQRRELKFEFTRELAGQCKDQIVNAIFGYMIAARRRRKSMPERIAPGACLAGGTARSSAALGVAPVRGNLGRRGHGW
jgi:hypothetical protein